MLAAATSLPQSTMAASTSSSAVGSPQHGSLCLNTSPINLTSSPTRVKSTVGLTITASATAQALPVPTTDNELTNLGWLHKPGVLNSMCTALTGSPHKHSRTGTRLRKPKAVGKVSSEGSGGSKASDSVHSRGAKDSDKMVNVILNVRNRKYNGEDAHKPPLSFACMIFMAIESSPTKTLPVKDIYDWIMWKFPYYQCASAGWKNSIRHNLSLNKCFKKVDRCSPKSKSAVCKGGLWTVDPDYRRSLLAALKRSPYHPYHRYFTPPLSPSSSNSSLDGLDPAERDAALTMCMISGGENGSPIVTAELLQAILHDHCYSKKPPNFIVPALPRIRRRRTGLTLDEVAAAAELILAQDEAAAKEEVGHESSDEGLGGEVDSDCDMDDDDDDDENDHEEEEEEEEGARVAECLLGDSGYGGQSMEELGADALLCLAGSSRSNSPPASSPSAS